MGLITLTAPGDVVGMVSSIANFGAEACKAVTAIVTDTSPAGLAIKADIAAFLAPIGALAEKADKLLGIKLDQVATSTPAIAPTTVVGIPLKV